MAEQTPAPTVRIGETVSGTVEHIAPYGAFIRISTGQKAMVHISEISHNFVKSVEDLLKIGQTITAKVVKIDDKGRVDLSIKAMTIPEPPAPRRQANRPPKRNDEDFEKKLASFIKFSDEKIADINTKSRAPHGTKRRTGHSVGGK